MVCRSLLVIWLGQMRMILAMVWPQWLFSLEFECSGLCELVDYEVSGVLFNMLSISVTMFKDKHGDCRIC